MPKNKIPFKNPTVLNNTIGYFILWDGIKTLMKVDWVGTIRNKHLAKAGVEPNISMVLSKAQQKVILYFSTTMKYSIEKYQDLIS